MNTRPNVAWTQTRRRTVLLDTTKDVVDVVWEESLRVQHRLDESCDGTEGHVFRVRMFVPLEETFRTDAST